MTLKTVKNVQKVLISAAIGILISVVSTQIPVGGVQLFPLSNPSCNETAQGLPLSFTSKVVGNLPLDCYALTPGIALPVVRLVQIGGVFLTDAVFWGAIFYFFYGLIIRRRLPSEI